MPNRNAVRSQRAQRLDNDLKPAVAHLRTTRPHERRNLVAREALLSRIRAEFEEMANLSITLPQATKLFGISPEVTSRILLGLVKDGVLQQTADGRYAPQALR
jgi:hypothetical protein